MWTILFVRVALLTSVATALVEPRPLTTTTATATAKKQRLFETTPEPSFSEESRQYRRTVYTHEDWARHRSPDRFWRNLATITSSGVYRSVITPVGATAGVATVVFAFNMLAGGYADLSGAHHDAVIRSQLICLPLTPFTLSSPSLGLLLIFRTNSSYTRWDEARKSWAMTVSHARDLFRMGVAFYDDAGVSSEKRRKDLTVLSSCTWAFVRSMQRHLSPEHQDEREFRQELFARLPAEQARSIIEAPHRPNRALFDLSAAIENLPMHFIRKNQIHSAVTVFEDNLGSCERLLSSPVPLVYTRHTARFLSSWLLLMPLALYEPFENTWNHIGMIPTTIIVSMFLFCIEELATQKEEPFTILPMQDFCDQVGTSCDEMVLWGSSATEHDFSKLDLSPLAGWDDGKSTTVIRVNGTK